MNALIILFVLSLIAILALGLLLRRSNKAKSALQQRLSVVESGVEAMGTRVSVVERRLAEDLTQDQIDYRDKVHAQYATLFQKLEEDFKSEVKGVRGEAVNAVQKSRKDFEGLLKQEFDKACEKIAFDEIEYKKTITKKRRQFNRKNSHRAKPAKIWRSISEE